MQPETTRERFSRYQTQVSRGTANPSEVLDFAKDEAFSMFSRRLAGNNTATPTTTPAPTTPTTPPRTPSTQPMHTFSDGSQITRAEKDERDRRERLGSVDFQQQEMMRAAQGQLNALNRHYSNLRKEQGVVNDQRSRGTQAVNTLTGLAGSTEANQTVARTDKENQQAMKLLADEQNLAVQEVLGMVRTAAVEEARAQRESFRLDMAAEDERRAAAKTEAVNNAKILAGAGVTADGYAQSDPEGFSFLSQQVGGEEVLRAMFTLNRPQEAILDKRVEGGKYVIAYQNPIDGKVRIESVDLGLPPSYTKTLDAGDRILAIPDNWSGDPSELITINKGLTPSQAASGGGGGAGGGGGTFSAAATSWAELIEKGEAKINNVPDKLRNEVARALADREPSLSGANQQAIDQSNTAIGAINTMLTQLEGIGSAGSAWQRWFAGNVPGTEARDFRSQLETVQALVGFDALAQMRAASPTGGALGQVTERELRFLQSVQGSLDDLQSTAQLRDTLRKVQASFERLRAINSVTMSPDEYKAKYPNATAQEIEELRARSNVKQAVETGSRMLVGPDGQVFDASALTPAEYQEALAAGYQPA